MKNLTIENAVKACSGRYVGPEGLLGTEIMSVQTDSRAVTRGAMFAAIRGERTDGHLYIPSAGESGAACALCEAEVSGCPLPQIVVPSTEKALQDIAAFYRQQFSIPFLGITGSVGKTTAKEMSAAVLSQHFNVMKTQGNFNNELGVPLTIFSLRGEHEAAVVEMGISHFGEMSRLTRIVCPDIALFTLIGYAHLESLGDRKGVLRAKSEILEGMKRDASIIINGDDDLLLGMECSQRKISFGKGEKCDFRAENIRLLPGCTVCDVRSDFGTLTLTVPGHGEHLAYAAAEGAAVGKLFGLTDEEIAAGAASYRSVGSRSRLVDAGDIRIIDDCYNANPNSVASALRSLASMDGRRVCILGDMLELGENARQLHRNIGEMAASLGIDSVITAGELSEDTALGAGEISRHFDSVEELVAALPRLIQPGDCVLVKASHSMHFERIVSALSERG